MISGVQGAARPERRRNGEPTPYVCPYADRISKMAIDVATVLQVVKGQEEDIRRDTRLLWGNGEEGLQTKVSKLVDDMAVIKKVAYFIIGIVLSVVVMDILWLIATHPIKGLTTP
jgi:hypothetical protein